MTENRPGRPPALTLVAAVARNGTIGADGGLPWHLPADLKRFKALTMGHPMIMGRRTFESIGRALPGRTTVVVTRDASWQVPGVLVAHSVPEAIAVAVEQAGDGPVMVVGGGEIYRQTMSDASRLEITHVDADVQGDTSFPDVDPQAWRESFREAGDGYTFVTYERRGLPTADATDGDRAEPVRDLSALLPSLRPLLHEGEYTFVTVPSAEIPAGLHPVATVAEDEGLTVVVPAEQARTAGLDGTFDCAWITLRVNSALDAVGLTAAVAAALTTDGIACNVMAGYHHDHLFVPYPAADRAMAALAALAHTRS